ncbi:glycosyltransferase family 4 protein [Roseiconus lacunae]|uniref:glycosyltransferase family 4 protein n=1 Tax=Roseiconus lacunae TaxID=2605694 RepID=UPI001E3E950F|nr:glycosyltransferase family 4 protein [Roseiconus lacunae]MCD0458889.1 glycosyltransferase family 4 protein [Roseiconus lacunae]
MNSSSSHRKAPSPPSGRVDRHPRDIVFTEVFPPQVGGSGSWIFQLFARQPSDSYVVLAGSSEGGLVNESGYQQQIERHPLSMTDRSIGSIRSLRIYAKQIRLLWKTARREGSRDIFAARPLQEGLVSYFATRLTRASYTCFVHGEDIRSATTSRELTLLTSLVLKNARRVIANSSYTYNMLRSEWKIPDSKIALLNPGIDTDSFPPHAGEKRRNGWKGKLVLLTVGRLQRRKGHDNVIKALPEIALRIPNIHYAIAGDGEEFDYLQSLVIENHVEDKVEFLGEIDNDELLKCYQDCDVFILANREIDGDVEGFGIVLLEAQSCGKPVVAGNSGGTRDTLIPNETGYLIDCSTPEQLTKTICEQLNCSSKRDEMGLAARSHVKSSFDWRVVDERMASIFSGTRPT